MSWQIEGLSKSFCIRRGFSSHSFPVLTDLSLQVSKGEFVGLAGASGSGKTTLAHIAMRLISADAGNMVLGGKPYGEYHDDQEFYRQIQLVFQHASEALNPRWIVRDILAEPLLHLLGLNRQQCKTRAEELMNEVRLPSRLLDMKPSQLSGGELQRVCLARALAPSPQFVILDEPTSSLDVLIQRQIMQLLERLNKQKGVAFLLLYHDVAVLHRVSDRVVFLRQGRLMSA